VITGDVVYVEATNEEELAKYKGKLKGAIVFTVPSREVKPGFEPFASRNTDENLAKLDAAKFNRRNRSRHRIRSN